MADEELRAEGLAVLMDLAAMLMEEAHETAASSLPIRRDERLVRIGQLGQLGRDLQDLARACEVLIERGGVSPGD